MRPSFPCHAGAKPQPNPLRHMGLHHTYQGRFLQIRNELMTVEGLKCTNLKDRERHVGALKSKNRFCRKTDALKLLWKWDVLSPKQPASHYFFFFSSLPPPLAPIPLPPSLLPFSPPSLSPLLSSPLSLLPSPPDRINICELLGRAQCYRPVHWGETEERRTREGRREEEKPEDYLRKEWDKIGKKVVTRKLWISKWLKENSSWELKNKKESSSSEREFKVNFWSVFVEGLSPECSSFSRCVCVVFFCEVTHRTELPCGGETTEVDDASTPSLCPALPRPAARRPVAPRWRAWKPDSACWRCWCPAWLEGTLGVPQGPEPELSLSSRRLWTGPWGRGTCCRGRRSAWSRSWRGFSVEWRRWGGRRRGWGTDPVLRKPPWCHQAPLCRAVAWWDLLGVRETLKPPHTLRAILKMCKA